MSNSVYIFLVDIICIATLMNIGEMPATFHSKVYEEYQSELIPGTVLILNKVVC